jgi:hypothetical protein
VAEFLGWQNIVSETPGVVSVSGTYNESTGGTLDITGTNFGTGAIASAIGTNGIEINASSTTVNSIVSVTAVFSGLAAIHEPYDIKVTNTSNLFGLLPDALYVNASPVWQTASGSLGTFNEQVSVSVSATATDQENTTITYSIANGSSLPSGVTLNSSTGTISGTLPNISTNTTYTFTVNATDGVNIVPRSFSITSNAVIPVDYLVVAGGGGGGAGYDPAGGGAGGLRSTVTATGGGGTLESALLLVKNSTYTVTVGTGGAGATGGNNTSGPGASGQNSVFHTITSIGGGGGGGYADGISRSPLSGGSGGGGTRSINGAAGTANQGYAGGGQAGAGNNAVNAGGGGGGAGGIGQAGVTNASGGTGGIGVASSITGSSVTRAVGGTGNFGSGNSGNASGAANTGNGGNGGSLSLVGGNGGSGIVVIAYPDTYPAITTIPGTLTYDQPTRAGYRVYRFTAGTGTITF